MYKTFSAATLALAIAFGNVAPSPAQAEQRQIGKYVVGAGALALAALAYKNYRDDKKEEEERKREKKKAEEARRQAQVYNTAPRVIESRPLQPNHVTRDPRDPPRIVVQNGPETSRDWSNSDRNRFPGSIEVRHTLPKSCQTTVEAKDGTRTVFPAACLQRNGIEPKNLPYACARILDLPGRNQDRSVFRRACLLESGYRIK